jgi:sensor histidine kinase regulating citrate/malate metabolism
MRRSWANLSLRLKITLAVLLLLLLALGMASAAVIVLMNRQIAREQQRSAEAIALSLARASELALAVQDKNELNRLVEAFLEHRDVDFIVIEDEKGQAVASGVRKFSACLASRETSSSRFSLVSPSTSAPISCPKI